MKIKLYALRLQLVCMCYLEDTQTMSSNSIFFFFLNRSLPETIYFSSFLLVPLQNNYEAWITICVLAPE